jgi:tripartite-type tricarboxylate transporter receptor subunit TctC
LRRKKFKFGILSGTFYGFLIIVFSPVYGFAQSGFYEGKTITVVFGSSPGGTADGRARAVVSVLQRHIPGKPTIVMEYMPGGGGRKAGNYIYRTARPDGLTIGAMTSGFLPSAVLGDVGVSYDIDKVTYLGSGLSGQPSVFYTRRAAGLSSLEKLRAASGVRIGATTVGTIGYNTGRLIAYLIGMKEPKFVSGYAGPEVDIAMMRGELDARATSPETIIRRNPDWIEKGLIDLHLFIEFPKGQKRHSTFAHLPDIETFTKSDRDRKVLELYAALSTTGAPFVLPPGTPADRLAILREASRKTFKDPEFHNEFKKLTGEDAGPLMPEDLEKAIRGLPRDPDVINLYKKLTGPDPLPSR